MERRIHQREETKVRGFFPSSRLHKEGAQGRGGRMWRPPRWGSVDTQETVTLPPVSEDPESQSQGSACLWDGLEPVTVRADARGTPAVQCGYTVQESTEHSLCCLANICRMYCVYEKHALQTGFRNQPSRRSAPAHHLPGQGVDA